MSGATGATGARGATGDAEAFAELLRGLKKRSGLSYGMLAKRLHMSTSTLHRYCNGSAVPADYAPVERFARVCRANPEELVELHRRWILADAARGRRGPESAARGAGSGAGGGEHERTSAPGERTPGDPPLGERASGDAASGATEPGTEPRGGSRTAAPAGGPPEAAGGPAGPGGGRTGHRGGAAEPAPAAGAPRRPGAGEEGVLGRDAPSVPVRRRRRRTALVASAAAVAVPGVLLLAANLPSSGNGGGRNPSAVVSAAATGSASATGGRKDREAVERPSAPGSVPASRDARTGEPSASTPESGGHTGGAAVNVATRPYVYDSPCSQHFLVDSEPEHVGPPAAEQDAPRWAAAYGAVSSGEQRIALTVQGTGEDTVVLEALHVRVLTKGAPLRWNDYSMGVGCGGRVDTATFDIDLDNGSPTVQDRGRDFPYKVSESDPEVFYVTAHTKAHDVRWDLSLEWSSGDRRGAVHIDDEGAAFRTSADAGRPGYDYPLGGSEWIRREE